MLLVFVDGFVILQVARVPWHRLADDQAVSVEELPVAGFFLLAVTVALEQMSRLFVRKDDLQNIEALVEHTTCVEITVQHPSRTAGVDTDVAGRGWRQWLG